MLSINERVFLVLQYAKLESVTLVQRSWKKEYNTRSAPDGKTIKAIYDKFCTTGSVEDLYRDGRPKKLEAASQCIAKIEQRPSVSLRKLASQTGVSHMSVQRYLHAEGLKPYKIQHVQELHDDDYAARESMCRELLHLIETENLLERVCFSDEATFHLSGSVNKHNCRFWGHESPHITQSLPLNSPKVTVWCAITQSSVIGPYFFDGNVTSESYLEMLQDFFLPNLTPRQKETMFFQQDGAPPHWGRNVRAFLHENFPNRWIGRDGPIPWAARSPDLTPLDFFFWGFVKTAVYATLESVSNLGDLKTSIRSAINDIQEEMLRKTFENVKKRYELCVRIDGGHIEPFL